MIEKLAVSGSWPALRTLVKVKDWPVRGTSMRMGRTPVAVGLGWGAASRRRLRHPNRHRRQVLPREAATVVPSASKAAVGTDSAVAGGWAGLLPAAQRCRGYCRRLRQPPVRSPAIATRGRAASRCSASWNFSADIVCTLPSANTTARPFTSEGE